MRRRSTTLDDPNHDPIPPVPPRSTGKPPPPPGLGAQIGATRDAAIALLRAHVDLAKAEGAAIAGEVGRIAALGALAFTLVILALFLGVVGTALFTAEWLLGSIGWGVVHGVLLFVAVAIAAILAAVGLPGRRIGGALLGAALVGLVLGVVLGLDLPNRLFAAVGDAVAPAIDPAYRPLAVGVVIGAILGLIAGIVVAFRFRSSGATRSVGLLALVVLGALTGAFAAITFGPQVAAGIGITIGYLVWLTAMGVDVGRTGLDLDTLKQRFYPTQTIDTSKETLEWLQKRMPPGIGS